MIDRVRKLFQRFRATSRRNAAIRRQVQARFTETDEEMNRAGLKRPNIPHGGFDGGA